MVCRFSESILSGSCVTVFCKQTESSDSEVGKLNGRLRLQQVELKVVPKARVELAQAYAH